jgi:hypothetical protein
MALVCLKTMPAYSWLIAPTSCPRIEQKKKEKMGNVIATASIRIETLILPF